MEKDEESLPKTGEDSSPSSPQPVSEHETNQEEKTPLSIQVEKITEDKSTCDDKSNTENTSDATSISNNTASLRTSRRTTSIDTSNKPLNDGISGFVANNSNNCNNNSITPIKNRRASGSSAKSPMKSPNTGSDDSMSRDSSSHTPPTPDTTVGKEQHKMTREERKIAAYMKAFERMEKQALRRQEMEKKKGEDRGRERKDSGRKNNDGDDEDGDKTSSADECVRTTPNDRSRKKG